MHFLHTSSIFRGLINLRVYIIHTHIRIISIISRTLRAVQECVEGGNGKNAWHGNIQE